MYTWHVDILLKDRMSKIECLWHGPEDNSGDVANAILHVNPKTFACLRNRDDNKSIFVLVDEIVCISVYPFE